MEQFADTDRTEEAVEKSQLFDLAADYVLAVGAELDRRLT